jgi:hypothetical protein
MKRIVAMADFHCGHRVGLTPPGWQYSADSGPKAYRKYAKFQKGMWDYYSKELAALQPIDCLFIVGDCVDGPGLRTGGTEQLTRDRNDQVDMAAACIAEAKAKKVYMIYGTAYHTGGEEDWEDIIADKIGAEIAGHEWVTVGKAIFDLKHHIGGSAIPHGRYTALAREALWNLVWARDKRQPDADVIIRAHVHYHVYLGDAHKIGIILPGLQGYGSKYGVRRCSGTVDIGFISGTIGDNGGFDWRSHILDTALLQIEPKKA